MALVKSHSNYVLKSRHQDVSDGTIYERDITTIGGVNQFAKGMTPIYRSNNFIITVRNDKGSTNTYGNSKWENNGNSGNTWTLENLSGLTSSDESSDSTKIVLKQDYYDFCDFAYYGSLSELFRASITDILSRFPGELYGTSHNTYYTTAITVDGESIEDSVRIGLSDNLTLYELDNPFGIDIHSTNVPSDADSKKYFANGGYKNYELIDDNDKLRNPWDIVSWSSDITNNNACVGGKLGKIDIEAKYKDKNGETKKKYTIYAYMGENFKVTYMFDKNSLEGDSLERVHIRPLSRFLDDFYNGCDNFEKLLMNRKSTPLYKATFSVLKEGDYGMYREFETFVFPTTYGGYNIDANDYGFTDYTARLSEIGEFYDNRVTDNIYRAMTHEAIKNFDWTYTSGDEEEYVIGGQKMQKALRVIGREFDEIKSYIDNLKNSNRLSYDERGNMPDYFLKDTLNDDGWDIKLVYPYDGEADSNGKCSFSISSQDNVVRPYSSDNMKEFDKEGFFMYKDDEKKGTNNAPCGYEGTDYNFVSAKGKGSTWYRCTIRNRIKPYSSLKEYSYHDVSNSFLRRLRLNSRQIWRNKGTLEGVEMILGMFGMKSERYCDLANAENGCLGLKPDYKIEEFSWKTEPIEDKWDCLHNMYRIDWINSTKNIIYDYRGTSNYSNASSDYISYQGLPIVYRYDKEEKGTEAPCEYEGTDYYGKRKRWLYPNFNKDEKYDGDPYFQMMGGWQDKTLDGTHFQFNEDSSILYFINFNGEYHNIAFTKNKEDGSFTFFCDYNGKELPLFFKVSDSYIELNSANLASNGIEGVYDYESLKSITSYVKVSCKDGDVYVEVKHDVINANVVSSTTKPMHKETVKSIRSVMSLSELLATPSDDVTSGNITYVTNVDKNVMIIDDTVYKIYTDSDGKRFVKFLKEGDSVKVTNSKYFSDDLTVFDSDFSEKTYDIYNSQSGLIIRAYIKSDGSFKCFSNNDGAAAIQSFMIMGDSQDGYSNYFILDDNQFSHMMARKYDMTDGTSTISEGWRRLKYSDDDYKRISTITNYFGGNNPHNGNMVYDNGYEYFSYFKELFKYACDNYLFDERCFDNVDASIDDEIKDIGFSSLTSSNYSNGLTSDGKVHYFGNYVEKVKPSISISFDNAKNEVVIDNIMSLVNSDETDSMGDDGEKLKWTVSNDTSPLEYSADTESNKCVIRLLSDVDAKFISKVILTPTPEKQENVSKIIQNYKRIVLTIYYVLDEDGKSIIRKVEASIEVPYDTMDKMDCSAKTKNMYGLTDKVTNQIMNTKRMCITFYLDKFKKYNKWNQVKYLDDIIMSYLTQMIPSTTILSIKYVTRNN